MTSDGVGSGATQTKPVKNNIRGYRMSCNWWFYGKLLPVPYWGGIKVLYGGWGFPKIYAGFAEC